VTSENGGAGGPIDDSVSLEAEKLVGGGRALAHHEGSTWMVAGALPGERIRAVPLKKRAGIIEASACAVERHPHPARLEEPCPHSGICGGCDWPHVDPTLGARLKASSASEATRGFPELGEMIAAARVTTSPDNYRLRARLHWDPAQRRLGFYEFRSRRVSSITSCRVLSSGFMKIHPLLEATLAKCCPEAIDLEWLEGTDDRTPVAALTPSKGGPTGIEPGWIPDENDLAGSVAGFHSLSPSGRPSPGWGAAEVAMNLPIPLAVPIGAFFQGNRHLIAPLFEKIAELIGSDPSPVFDLHAGVGYLAAAALHAGDREMTLVEPNRIAAEAAGRNLPAAEVVGGSTAEEFAKRRKSLPNDAIAITDPPRSGLTKPLRERLAAWRPKKILMLGCDPATWARDAGFLVSSGYRVSALELFDLFPSTHHVEILALLERE